MKVRTQLSQCGKLGEFSSNSAAVCSLHHKKEQNTLGHWQVWTRIFIHQIIKASIWLIGGDFVQLNKQPKKRSEAKRWKHSAAVAQRVGARRSPTPSLRHRSLSV